MFLELLINLSRHHSTSSTQKVFKFFLGILLNGALLLANALEEELIVREQQTIVINSAVN